MTEAGWIEAKVDEGRVLRVTREHVDLPPAGTHVLIKVRQPRNIKHHRKYWGLLKAVAEATGQWASVDALHRWVKIELQHYVAHPQPSGIVIAEYLPTDFAAMPQKEFADFYERALAAIAMETGIDPETLLKEAVDE